MHYAIRTLIYMCIFFAAAWSFKALAQTARQGSSFIKLFPKDDVYHLKLVGDWFADGLHGAVNNTMGNIGQVRTATSVLQVRSLRNSTWNNVLRKIKSDSAGDPIDIAIVMFGAAEFGSIRVPGSRRLRLGTENWRKEYTARIDRVMKALKQNETAVYWMGIPTLRNERYDDNAQIINEILRERAYINGVKYIDTYARFSDEEGEYDTYGPDLTGKIRRLRSQDGFYFTYAGYQKLAHFAKRVIASDIRRAISERKIPLAGSELEQSRINPKAVTPDKTKRQFKHNGKVQSRQTSQRLSSHATSAPSPLQTVRGLKDLKADHGKIMLRTVKGSIARRETMTIVRPAIPATVLALLTRSHVANNKNQISQNLQVELSNGITLMTSISLSSRNINARKRRQLSLSQSPFFRVWAKGERLEPRPGRADDIEWPRPEHQPVVRAGLSSQPNSLPNERDTLADIRKYTPEGFPPLPQPNPRAR